MPEAFAPPQQIQMPSGPEPAITPIHDPRLIEMSDPEAASHILADLLETEPGLEWRFTGSHPRFRLQLDSPVPANFVFYLRFFNHEQAIKARGPVAFDVTINGHRFRSYRFSAPGDIEYRRPIPGDWIAGARSIEIALDIDPPWRQSDGVVYGVSIHSIGFAEP